MQTFAKGSKETSVLILSQSSGVDCDFVLGAKSQSIDRLKLTVYILKALQKTRDKSRRDTNITEEIFKWSFLVHWKLKYTHKSI